MSKKSRVERPTKKAEYAIYFATRDAERGWRDLKATTQNALADSWDFLTRTPQDHTPVNYPLRGDLSTVTRNGVKHARWQHKLTTKGDARIWFYVDQRCVYLVEVHTSHPNATK